MIDTIIATYTDDNPENPVFVIGRKTPGETPDIINAFQGDAAKKMYTALVTSTIIPQKGIKK